MLVCNYVCLCMYVFMYVLYVCMNVRIYLYMSVWVYV